MTWSLIIFTFVAGNSGFHGRDWRLLDTGFTSEQQCRQAAFDLGYDPKDGKFRCIVKGKN